MALYMDIHEGVGSVSPEEMETAHQKDLAVQHKHGVRFLTYWLNDPAGHTFCLVEAPHPDAVVACHKEAHGLLPHKLVEVTPPTLAAFMGDWQKSVPNRAMVDGSGTAPDTGLRTLMFTDIEGSTDISTRQGDERAMEVVRSHNAIVRARLSATGGREVKHTGDGLLASFTSVSRALQCAIDIQAACREGPNDPGFRVRIGMSAGEPVEESDDLYGAAVNLAARVCAVAQGGQILVSRAVKELAIGKSHHFAAKDPVVLKGFQEPVPLFEVLQER
jgi:class 3 adenylate cyclase